VRKEFANARTRSAGVAEHVDGERAGLAAVVSSLSREADDLVRGVEQRLDPDRRQLEVVLVVAPAGAARDRLLARVARLADLARDVLAVRRRGVVDDDGSRPVGDRGDAACAGIALRPGGARLTGGAGRPLRPRLSARNLARREVDRAQRAVEDLQRADGSAGELARGDRVVLELRRPDAVPRQGDRDGRDAGAGDGEDEREAGDDHRRGRSAAAEPGHGGTSWASGRNANAGTLEDGSVVRPAAYPLHVKVLGIDPGTAACGFGIVQESGGRLSAIAHGWWRTSARERPELRLRTIFEGVTELIEEHAPGFVVLEESFVGADARIALSVGQARGAVLVASALAGIECAEYAPARVKQAVCGYGRAEKAQVARMVQTILALAENERPVNSHASDALAV